MNILPTNPHTDFDLNYDRYFADLKRWNFDVAYNAHYAFPLREVQGRLEHPYRLCTQRVGEEGFRSCIQIQSTVAHSDDVPVSESQRRADNSLLIYEHHAGEGQKNHFGSFASRRWLEHLKGLARLFREYGFDWVVFEEPMIITDIPGPEDPMRRLWAERYPNLSYPTRQSEGREYLLLQSLKRDAMVEFFGELCRLLRHAPLTPPDEGDRRKPAHFLKRNTFREG